MIISRIYTPHLSSYTKCQNEELQNEFPEPSLTVVSHCSSFATILSEVASPQTARGGSTDACPSSAFWRDKGGHKLPTQGQPIAGHQQLLAFPAAPGALLWGAHSPWARTGIGWILLRGVRLWIPWSKSVFIFWRLFAFLCNKNIPNARWVSESQAGRYDSRQGISNRNFESRSMLWVISKRHWCSAGLPVN